MKDNFTPAPYYRQPNRRTRAVRKAAPSIRRFSGQVFAKLAQQTRYMEPALASRWSELVGTHIADICRPGRILSTGPHQGAGQRGKTLEIITRDGTAATQLHYEKARILKGISKVLGPGTVTELKIQQFGTPETKTATLLTSEITTPGQHNNQNNPFHNSIEETGDRAPSPLEDVLREYHASLKNKGNKNKEI